MGSQTEPSLNAARDQARNGFFFTLGAFTLWGLMPLYMKAVAHVGALEILANRIIWSIPLALIFLLLVGRTSDIVRVANSPSKLLAVAACATFISINWGFYVWAIAAGRTVEAALGYYINPLISILLGMVLLGEKLNRMQLAALTLAIIAVSILTVATGELPWVALILACSFAFYGLIKKTTDIGPTQGFMLEVLILSLIAFPYLFYLGNTGALHFGGLPKDTYLLIGCGPVTAIPLILFSYGAKRLPLTTLGLMQYITPSMVFLTGVFWFEEPFGQTQFVAFVLIWLAIILYSWSGLRGLRKPQSAFQ